MGEKTLNGGSGTTSPSLATVLLGALFGATGLWIRRKNLWLFVF